MRFDPQSNYVAEGASGNTTARGFLPRAGLRGQVVAFVAAVAGVLAVWIWQQSGSPATAVGAAEQPSAAAPAVTGRADTSQPSTPSATERPEPEPVASADATSSTAGGAAANIEQTSTLEFSYSAETTEQDRHRLAELLIAGKAHLSAGRSRAAIRTLRQAVELDPDSADARYNLGLAYVLSGDAESARGMQRELEDLDPSLASLLGNLVR